MVASDEVVAAAASPVAPVVVVVGSVAVSPAVGNVVAVSIETTDAGRNDLARDLVVEFG